MLSMASVGSAGGAAKYFAADNYYTLEESAEESLWFGEGAELLGLAPGDGDAIDSESTGETVEVDEASGELATADTAELGERESEPSDEEAQGSTTEAADAAPENQHDEDDKNQASADDGPPPVGEDMAPDTATAPSEAGDVASGEPITPEAEQGSYSPDSGADANADASFNPDETPIHGDVSPAVGDVSAQAQIDQLAETPFDPERPNGLPEGVSGGVTSIK
jgi:hypothetical protein